MLNHGYIENDFDVDEWAAPEFLEQACGKCLRKSGRHGVGASCPEGGALEAETMRLG